ncbi:MAG: lysine 2,3-aminomutase [Anaerolineae bacterium]|nr:lysine 2,3-aminomutase [Anaerolineae bacterium]
MSDLPAYPPQGRTPRPAIWADVPDAQWDDWRWQLSHRLNTVEDFARIINLTPEEIAGLSAPNKFRVDVTPYFASLIDPDDPDCPVRLQVIPRARELEAFEGMMEDSLAEDAHSPVPGLVHRYPDRVLMLVTTQCASYCRYCTRSRIVGNYHATFSRRDHDLQIEYIRRTPQVRDVLLSGGDPLILPQPVLEDLLHRLRAIPHVEIIRIGTRVPVFLPQRITDELVDMLRKYHPLWMNIHVNHPKEITPELARACAKLADAGIPLGNQSVLLAGVNDHPNTILKLVHELVKMRVRPYYLYQCDLVRGSGHFRTTVAAGLEIMEALRGHTSGYAIPTYAVDLPGGGGKVPVMPNYLIAQSHDRLVFRNFEGYISTYVEPTDYQRPKKTKWVPDPPLAQQQQRGVAGLLAGEDTTIKPEGWHATHTQRGASFEQPPAEAQPDETELPIWMRMH